MYNFCVKKKKTWTKSRHIWHIWERENDLVYLLGQCFCISSPLHKKWAKHLAKFNKDWYEFDMWAVIMNFFTPRLWQWKHKNICLLVAYTQKLYCAEWQQRIVKNVRRENILWESLTTWGIFFTDKLKWSFMKKKTNAMYNLELTSIFFWKGCIFFFIHYLLF